jgi:leucyl-tRNA synthetase
MGATYCAVAAEHPLATRAAKENVELAKFVDECRHGSVMEADMATMEKKGMPTGFFVNHPISGAKLPVWVANYVLMGYGEGAVMAVPAHDERDFEFATKHGLPIRMVIASTTGAYERVSAPWQDAYAEYGVTVDSGEFSGLGFEQAVDAIATALEQKQLGRKRVQYRLRDWGISRQRYWGTPIPIVHCDRCGDVPVPEDQLPVILPEDCVPDGSGNPLNKRADFVNIDCPKCGTPARRETDTMDTFVDSSWYFLRYACPHQSERMVDQSVQYWLPVDQYIGGIEHAILHLLYSRFWTKVMRDLGLVSLDEPFANLLTQGMVLNEIFFRKTDSGRIAYFNPADVDVPVDEKGQRIGAILRADGQPVEAGGIGTMSKSKNNGVDPQALIEEYGADTARFFIMFASPPEQTLAWSDAGVEGSSRFLKKLWSFAYDNARVPVSEVQRRVRERTSNDQLPADFGTQYPDLGAVRRELHLNLKQATYDLERHQFNTVASSAMKILNSLGTLPRVPGENVAKTRAQAGLLNEGMSILLRLLSPIAPHICHQLWRDLGYAGDILDAPWPAVDETALVQDEIDLVLQVNGKLRGNIRVAKDADRAAIERTALDDPGARRFIAGQPVKKVVIVPGRLVNVVV